MSKYTAVRFNDAPITWYIEQFYGKESHPGNFVEGEVPARDSFHNTIVDEGHQDIIYFDFSDITERDVPLDEFVTYYLSLMEHEISIPLPLHQRAFDGARLCASSHRFLATDGIRLISMWEAAMVEVNDPTQIWEFQKSTNPNLNACFAISIAR